VKLNFFVKFIVNYYKFLELGITLIVAFIILLEYRKKITSTYVCPNCKTSVADRLPRNFIEKIFQLNNITKKFICLKCWKIYYVRESKENTI